MESKKNIVQLKIFFTLCYFYSGICFCGEYYYDLNFLRGINYNPEGSNNRIDAFKNIDGVYNVRVIINNRDAGNLDVKFKNIKNNFVPELSDELNQKVGFNRDVLDFIKKERVNDLLALIEIFDEISFDSLLDKKKLIIKVPESRLRYYDETFPDEWDYGLNTFFSSYNFSGYNSNYKNVEKSKYEYLNLYNGVNLGKWQLRNKSYYNRYNEQSEFYSDQTWLSRDIGDLNSRFTVGQTTTSGLLTPTFRIDGVKLESIAEMRPSFMNGYLPDIQGNALTNAVVKIFQGNTLVYQTFVSPGIFNLTNIPISGNTDLRVQVIEENGSIHEDIVPVSSSNILRRKNVLDYSISIGKQNTRRNDAVNKNVISGEMLYGITSFGTLLSGGTYSENYQSLTLGGGLNLGDIGATSILATDSSNLQYDKHGSVIELRHYKKLSSISTQINFSHQFFMDDYSVIDDELNDYVINKKRSLTSLSLSQPTEAYGNFSFSLYNSCYEKKSENKKTYTLNWSKYLYGAFYTLSSSRTEYVNRNHQNENVFSINVSIPINSESRAYIPSIISYNYTTGEKYVSSTTLLDKNLFNNKVRVSLSNSNSKYSNLKNNSNKISASYLSDYANIYSGYTKSSNGYQQNSWRLSGALIVHPFGITASPHNISNNGASGIVSIPGASGVSLNNTINKTDYFGNAMVNNLRPYKKNKINISSRDMPSNVELQNLETNVIPANGAIIRAEFNAAVGNKAILNLVYEGKEVPFGSTVIEDPSSFANGNGTMYVTGLSDKQKIKIKMPDGKTCNSLFDISKAEKNNGIYFYEGTCE